MLVAMAMGIGLGPPFGASSTFGGAVPTPTLDGLAAEGLRDNNFHVTAQCSSTRAALLTGRNPHAVGMGEIPESGRLDPGYTTVIPRSAALTPRILGGRGYRTAGFGKYHLIPKWELSAVGPFDHWPTSMGFDHFYGFEPAMTDQFTPNLIENTRILPSPHGAGYAFERDLADRAIHWLREARPAAPGEPFFVDSQPGGGSGVIANQSGRFAGWGIFLLNGVPHSVYRSADTDQSVVQLRAAGALEDGPNVIEVRFVENADGDSHTGGGATPRSAEVTMAVNGHVVGRRRIENPVGSAFMYQGAAIGHSTGSALTDEYAGRFEFTGTIDRVEFQLDPRR